MYAYGIVLIVLSFSAIAESICNDRFPLRETSDIIKKIVHKYSVEVNSTEKDETWINHLILKNDSGYVIDGITYFLNDNRLNPDQTFYFDSLRFLSFPAFVIDNEDMISNWQANAPDNTYILSKISLNCPADEIACGLQCCPRTFNEIMIMVRNTLIKENKSIITNDTVSFNGINYGLTDYGFEHACEYTLSFYDTPLRSSINEYSKIYFKCDTVEDCCGLTCSEKPKTEASMQEANYLRNILADYNFYLVASIIFVIGFIAITYISYRRRDLSKQRETGRESSEQLLNV